MADQDPPAPTIKETFDQAIAAKIDDVKAKRVISSLAIRQLAEALGLDSSTLRATLSELVGRPVAKASDLDGPECDAVLFVLKGRWNEREHAAREAAERGRRKETRSENPVENKQEKWHQDIPLYKK